MFAPLKLSVPALTFTNDPAPVPPSAIAPANVPLLTVNAVPSNPTNPVDAPFNVNNVTALAPNETVPSAVTTALTGTNAPSATLNVAPAATVNPVEAKLPLPVNANVPAFTLVVPVTVFTPLKLNVPALTFTSEPVPLPPFAITPANVPSFNVNAVPFKATDPVTPFNVNNSAAVAESDNVPSTVNTADADTAAKVSTDNVAPLATLTAVDAKLPPPVNANVPALTVVDPV